MEVNTGYKKTENWIIPEDWDVAFLNVVCDVRDGTHESPKYYSTGIPLVTSKNIIDGKLDLTNVSLISENDADLIDARSKVDSGDLLLSMIGTVGNVAKVDVKHRLCIKNVALIKPRKISGEYLLHFLRSDLFTKTIQSSLAGGIQKFVSLGVLRSMCIPIMIDSEQERISLTLSDIYALVTSLEKLIEKKKNIKQGAMQELLTGKRRLPGFTGEWEKTNVESCFNVLKGKGLSKSHLNTSGHHMCILYGELFTTYTDVIEIVVSSTNSNEGIDSVAGDILLPGSTTTTGIDLAKASALMMDDVRLGGDINILRPTRNIDSSFLAMYLNTVKRNKIAEKTKGITIHHLHGNDLQDVLIELPTLMEQIAISSAIITIHKEVRSLENLLSKYKLIKDGMMQELLTGRIRLV